MIMNVLSVDGRGTVGWIRVRRSGGVGEVEEEGCVGCEKESSKRGTVSIEEGQRTVRGRQRFERRWKSFPDPIR